MLYDPVKINVQRLEQTIRHATSQKESYQRQGRMNDVARWDKVITDAQTKLLALIAKR